MTDVHTEGMNLFKSMMHGLIPENVTTLRDGSFGNILGQRTLDQVLGRLCTRPGLDRRSRIFVTLGEVIALRAPKELKFHCQFAFRNGMTIEEIEELIYHMA